MRKLEAKVAIITGAGQGIGRGMALAFAKEGAEVAVVDVNPDMADQVTEELRQLGFKSVGICCDVGDEGQVREMVATAATALGPIDILVNNAQAWGPKRKNRHIAPIPMPLEEFPEEWWDNTFQTGLKGTFYCCKAVFPHMKDRGGAIVNFGSTYGYSGSAGMVDYNACKEGIRALTRTAAREWAKYNIRANVICPSAETPALKAWREADPEGEAALRATVPLGRWGDPETDLGRAAVFLVSDDSRYLTGKTIELDGGAYMKP
jgi:NAD(P)-dependent dehydrogenase (short-subunit alcohol dehydrogenase family)